MSCFLISSNDILYAPSHRQIEHTPVVENWLEYDISPPRVIDLMTHWTKGRYSITELRPAPHLNEQMFNDTPALKTNWMLVSSWMSDKGRIHIKRG